MSIKNKYKKKTNTKIFNDMEVGHLLIDAEKWWNAKGSDMLKKRQFSEGSRAQQEALDAVNPLHVNYIGGESGILLGLPWEKLRPDEKYRILKVYTLTLKETLDNG